MDWVLRLTTKIDALTDAVARAVRWSLLLDALLIAGNAVSRKFLGLASNFVLDLQFHFFAAVVLLMAGYTLKRDQHVRIDVFAHRFGERGLAWLDLVGYLLFVLPLCALMVWFGWPIFVESYRVGEVAREFVGGVPRWVMKGLIPLGFLLLGIQTLSEAIKCVACLTGKRARPVVRGELVEER